MVGLFSLLRDIAADPHQRHNEVAGLIHANFTNIAERHCIVSRVRPLSVAKKLRKKFCKRRPEPA